MYDEQMERTSLHLPSDLHAALRDEARRQCRSQEELIREALRAYLSSQGRSPVTSIGLGEDSIVSARDAEAWLEREEGQP